VKLDEILRLRISRHHLGAAKGKDVVAVARRISGLHAQVTSSAQAAADLRLPKAADLERALYKTKTLVRTWAARGTLHLLPAADLPRWVAAMSTRTRENTPSWLRYNGVTAEQMRDLAAALPDVLGDTPLTREELATGLITATRHDHLAERLTQGFGSILKPFAFRGLLCSGPPRGRNVTFVAPQQWLGPFEPPPAEEAIDAIVLEYLGAYGPAQPEEFARWFDLKPPLAKKSFQRLADRLIEVPGLGHLPAELDGDVPAEDTVLLLPAFDPYVVGNTGRLDQISSGPRAAVSRPQGWISPTLVVNGRIEGVWEDSPGGPRVSPFKKLPAAVRRALPETAILV
jgi:Winged helix DNA-binding domain